MRIVPVIDVRGGRAVAGRAGRRALYAPVVSRLRGGDPEDLSDPLLMARTLSDLLASQRVYVADLDRIEGTGDNDAVVSGILDANPGLSILWDGGFARPGDPRPDRARLHPVFATETMKAFESPGPPAPSGRLAAAPPWFGLDLEEDGPMARATSVSLVAEQALLRRAAGAGYAGAVIVLLRRVGTRSGLPRERLQRLRDAAPSLPLVAGGGIGSMEDLLFLKGAGYEGALVATALHDGRLTPGALRGAGFA